MKHKVKKMRRPVKRLCLTLNLVLLPEATTDMSVSCALPQVFYDYVSVIYMTPQFYFISFHFAKRQRTILTAVSPVFSSP